VAGPRACVDSRRRETYAGGTRFITGNAVRATISERVRDVELTSAVQGVLVVRSATPGQALLELLDHENRASFDDRTLAVAWRAGGDEQR
jgi:hypothetical protein